MSTIQASTLAKVANCGTSAIFLWLGIPVDQMPRLSAQHGGQIGIADWVSQYAKIVELKFADLSDCPGVYHYEVVEEMGNWLGVQADPSIQAFENELQLKTEAFLNQ